ncbi:hypothetical protein BDV95DRAFT_214712 [Massariosphaeria phaeospora]|uniref:CFEM domain-containing protein n=1 Tax=Massariosphaeria phaeospora TaxID=100035 RepID=A0A7C8M368_9PLEO|nr:hypothetical protein BDV95DRAFT_214712 [Massariosphaeria phaeospora]
MKSFALLVVGAGVAIAQSLADLPQCGQTCISNMLSIAQREFSCQPGDAACYCSDARFGLGVRDCANEACSADEAGQVISYGSTYCPLLLPALLQALVPCPSLPPPWHPSPLPLPAS